MPPQDRRAPRPAGRPPDAARLREAALNHLARFAATEVALRRVLERRVDRWARAAEAEGQDRDMIAAAAASARAAAAEVARAMVAAGAVDDAAFAESRARRLARAGRSRRAIAAHLAAKGVAPETAGAALPEDAEAELAAALAFCRRRRIGPFARATEDAEARRRALAAMARGGYPHGLARQALAMDPDEAEERLLAARRG
ncbi:RecX family transcriptional regulator [Roseomonas sp. PWR1]|uniref:Regulatory protein RecX n=1 Tax=Roseomonas nitratireducens TaxID=2820810 RepID=A0ABS4AMY5_9PROT|nr:RecX family transcriptional regulator [Neoroseomonas nitratireducens]MBP0462724.1 RecX family transcriptional regulator [Neoroseomonas nitratireducens]